MTDGYLVSRYPDGMGCFAGAEPDTFVLLRNHENSTDAALGPYAEGQLAPPQAFDPLYFGGVTRVVVDAVTLKRRSSNLVLVGTDRNCAGGVSPWGWLTCEESVAAGHGYVFLCPSEVETVRNPQKIPGYGRFRHEAACVDPATNIAYLTEDRNDGCFYRFVPESPISPFLGKLQALAIPGLARFDTGTSMRFGQVLACTWIDIDVPDPIEDTVRIEAQDKGAATFVRGEGIWFDGKNVIFAATTGGPRELGQVFRHVPDAEGGGTLEVIAEACDRHALAHPDNVTVAPWGDIFIAEDAGEGSHLRILTRQGQLYPFARNASSVSELAGVCFSPDGRAMFVNFWDDGITLVVTGPWSRYERDGVGPIAVCVSDEQETSSDEDSATTEGSSDDAQSDGTTEAGEGYQHPKPVVRTDDKLASACAVGNDHDPAIALIAAAVGLGQRSRLLATDENDDPH